MTPQDWEDMAILKDAVVNIVLCLKEITRGDIHCFHDNTELMKDCGSKLMRIAYLTDKLYDGNSLIKDEDN